MRIYGGMMMKKKPRKTVKVGELIEILKCCDPNSDAVIEVADGTGKIAKVYNFALVGDEDGETFFAIHLNELNFKYYL
jgi:hypothetical protein